MTPADVVRVHEIGKGLSLQALVTGRHSDDALSLTDVALDGVHRPLRSRRTTRSYDVLEGAFDVQVEQDPAVPVQAGEVPVLAPGAAYGLAGRGRYLVLDTPAFRDGGDEYLDGARPGRTQRPRFPPDSRALTRRCRRGTGT